MNNVIYNLVYRALRSIGYFKFELEVKENGYDMFEVRGYVLNFKGQCVKNFLIDVCSSDTFNKIVSELVDRIELNYKQSIYSVKYV
jgi:hypothetical protein